VSEPSRIERLLAGLAGDLAEEAWAEFLRNYSPVLMQVARVFAATTDDRADCYLFLCEQLAARNFRRLRKFRVAGSASFSTWLRAVARNLCIDWYRKVAGRHDLPTAVAQLPARDRAVFQRMFTQRYSADETLRLLQPTDPEITLDEVDAAAERIRLLVPARQLFLLQLRSPQIDSLDDVTNEAGGAYVNRLADPAPGQECALLEHEHAEAVRAALARLNPADRLLLQLRYEQDLTLQEVARLSGLRDAQTADRRIRAVLDELRRRLGGLTSRFAGKTKPAAV
jgi:RNA polymerase sigma factor (sigma-70 family)